MKLVLYSFLGGTMCVLWPMTAIIRREFDLVFFGFYALISIMIGLVGLISDRKRDTGIKFQTLGFWVLFWLISCLGSGIFIILLYSTAACMAHLIGYSLPRDFWTVILPSFALGAGSLITMVCLINKLIR